MSEQQDKHKADKSAHTPGPWYTSGKHPYVVAITESSPGRFSTVMCGKNTGGGCYWPATGIGGRSYDEIRSNARLIAAAPSMLLALQLIIKADDMKMTSIEKAKRLIIARKVVSNAIAEDSCLKD